MLLVSLVAACAVEDGADDEADVAGEEEALASHAIAGYAAVAPAEERVATKAIAARLGPAIAAGTKLAVIRTMTFEGKGARVVVNADTQVTSLVDAAALAAGSRGADVDGTAYARSLAELRSSGKALRSLDADAPRVADESFTLTIDMCQSRKPWEKRLFDWAVALSGKLGKPVPIGIAMTGGWAKNHSAELDQILAWERGGKLAITWINHSSTHPLHCLNESCSRANFLTDPRVDFDEEVLGLERTLLARGIVPAVLFRFPGLVHDANRLRQLNRLSLMPLDADGWIAKGEPIKDRAVVLVHGNGNEPQGITGFLDQVQRPARAATLTSGKSALVSPLLAAPVQ
ncbi:MAG: hypothetical protein KIT84_38070 [Labilithrix sp.]|nr:hypothetical protein [Labilithrix sp.]